ncbi:hypothetical protein HYQ46_003984 [Verticillium longisporum]|nr:hypothetical protein HYQ46_003984 [Verticillium longisporum]
MALAAKSGPVGPSQARESSRSAARRGPCSQNGGRPEGGDQGFMVVLLPGRGGEGSITTDTMGTGEIGRNHLAQGG